MAAKTSVERFASVTAPSGRVYRKPSGDQGMGDGDLCPTPGHGKMYVMSSGRQHCVHQAHDMGVPRDGSEPHEPPYRKRKETPDGDDTHPGA